MQKDDLKYRQEQFNRLVIGDDGIAKIKIVGVLGETNYMNITRIELDQIINLLIEGDEGGICRRCSYSICECDD